MTLQFYPRIPVWPAVLLRDQQFSFDLAANTQSGGRSLAGASQVGRLDGGGLWLGTLGNVVLTQPAHIRAWRALKAKLDGGATPVILPARDPWAAPWPGTVKTAPVVTHSDGSTFSDGTRYVGRRIVASLAADAVLRATFVEIDMLAGADLRGGERFSIQHGEFSHRAYEIGMLVRNRSGTYTAQIRPPLREDTDAGTRLEFDTPKCVMQLATADAMALPLEFRKYGRVSVKLIESTPPWTLPTYPEADRSEALTWGDDVLLWGENRLVWG